MVWRGFAGFVVFSVVFILSALLLGLLFSLGAFIGGGWPTSWIPVAAGAVGGIVGVMAGVIALDHWLKTYPSNWLGSLFIVLNLVIATSALALVPSDQWNRWFWSQVVRALVAIAAAIYVFWMGRSLRLKT